MNILSKHSIPLQKLIAELKSDTEKGLSRLEAANRLKEFGRNIIQSEKGKHPLKILLAQFHNPMVYLLYIQSRFWM